LLDERIGPRRARGAYRGRITTRPVGDADRISCPRVVRAQPEDNAMLHYAIVFFVIALIAAVFGFTGIAAGAAEIAKILFYIFLVVFVVTLLLGVLRT
jgi:uncharacterized membrane protein YtjA (UPF0391 family)